MNVINKIKPSDRQIILIGYSGHAYVVADVIQNSEREIYGYCEMEEKHKNPFSLKYLGNEDENEILLKNTSIFTFVAIGDNLIRENISNHLKSIDSSLTNIISNSAIISSSVSLSNGILIGQGSIINACSVLGEGVICNSGSIIEHECTIEPFAHIAPGAILCGNVKVGSRSFIGAGSVIKEGITIGADVIVGAGTVIIKDIPSGHTVVGNPQRKIK